MSVLESPYEYPTRPYCQLELGAAKDNLCKSLRLSDQYAKHVTCKHCYFVKINGKKHNDIIERNEKDTGNCSVCWKLSKTPHNLQKSAYAMVNDYQNYFYYTHGLDSLKLTHSDVDIERVFYTWLYREFESRDNNNNNNKNRVNKK
jgi:hypothetical protein